ncbi:putative MFS family arabinose efflux permease [Georgenia soli]|uniref:Putative MFS family arabinose efflux permease n=1 Tax=Georgenia soli TaxID=638953 RepID=A0A2A9EPN5_9MICO|nr:MFS transporter [Georgenia soli]PFG41067.1 putative MFS family arabinose efflux permease [Georgenia soli]
MTSDTDDDGARSRDVFRLPGFAAFWAAASVSELGNHVTVLALQVLVVVTLGGTATDVGLLNATRWLPYLALGLVVGALLDRRRRRPVLVVTDLGRAVLLGLIPALWLLDVLSLPVLLVVVAAFGALSLLHDAASQSFLPRLVPRSALLAANARLDQSGAVAQTSGPLLAGGLVTALGAPVAVLADALTFLFSAVMVARLKVSETVASAADGARRRLRSEIADGLRWVYGHRTLAPLALSTHGWFLCNSMLATAFVPFALLGLGLDAFGLSITLAAGGVGALGGSLFSTRAGLRWGAGRTVVASRAAMPLAWILIALTPDGAGVWVAVAVLGAGQLLHGFAMGLENANEMGYWQAVTPDAFQGRTNATRRSVNRAMIVVGAPLGGVLADAVGYRPVLWAGAAGFAVVAAGLAASPFREARHGEPQGTPRSGD